MVGEYPCSICKKNRVSFFESFYQFARLGNDYGVRFIDNETCHVLDCTAQIKATQDNPIILYADGKDKADEGKDVLEKMFGVELFREGWR